MPGIKKEDVSIEVNDGVLTISAQTKQSREEKKENYVFSERRSGQLQPFLHLERHRRGEDQRRLRRWRAETDPAQAGRGGQDRPPHRGAVTKSAVPARSGPGEWTQWGRDA